MASQSTSFVKQSKIRKKKRKSVYVHTGPINGTRDLIHADPPLEQRIAGRFWGSGFGSLAPPVFHPAAGQGQRTPSSPPGPGPGTERWDLGHPCPCWALAVSHSVLGKGRGRKRVFSSLFVDSLLQAICYNNSQNKPQQTQTEITRAFSDIRAFNLCKYCTKQIKYCKLY